MVFLINFSYYTCTLETINILMNFLCCGCYTSINCRIFQIVSEATFNRSVYLYKHLHTVLSIALAHACFCRMIIFCENFNLWSPPKNTIHAYKNKNTTRDTCKIKTLQTYCIPKSWPYTLINFKHCTLNTPLISHLHGVTPHLVT